MAHSDGVRYSKVATETIRRSDLSVQARLLYAVLATYADRSGVCRPSIEDLCTVMGLSRSNVMRYLDELIGAEIVTRGGTNRNREYLLNGPADRTIEEESNGPTGRTIPDVNSPTDRTIPEPNSPAGRTIPANSPAGRTIQPNSPTGRTIPDANSPAGRTIRSAPRAPESETLSISPKREPLQGSSNTPGNDERERGGARAREADRPDGWTEETMPIYEAYIEWFGHPPPANHRATIHQLLQPRGSPVGARLPGSTKLFNGFTVEQVVQGVQDLRMSEHNSPAALVKHIAGLLEPVTTTSQRKGTRNGTHRQQHSGTPATGSSGDGSIGRVQSRFEELKEQRRRQRETTSSSGD